MMNKFFVNKTLSLQNMGSFGESWVFMKSLDSPPTPIKLELYYYFIAAYESGKVLQSE